jgi:hypothetical protein
VFDDKIVTAAFSPGFADGESVLGGASHEAQFCPLSALFVLFDGCPCDFHEDFHSNKKRGPGRSRVVEIHYISRIAG